MSLELTLLSGHYIIIPSTFSPNNEGSFQINVKTQKDNSIEFFL